FYEAHEQLVQQGISSNEGIREVLEAQESISEVVQRVKLEILNEPDFQETDVKGIINTISSFSKKTWNFLTVKRIQTQEWYKSNQSPLLSGFTYLGGFFVYLLGMVYLAISLPLLILYQTHPNKVWKIAIGEIPSSVTNDPTVTAVTEIILSNYLFTIITLIIWGGFIVRLSYKRTPKDGLLTLGYFIFPIFILDFFNESKFRTSALFYRLHPTVQEDYNRFSGIITNQDWYRSRIPTIPEYLYESMNIVFSRLVFLILLILGLWLIGRLIKEITVQRSRFNMKSISKGLVAISLLVGTVVLPFPLFPAQTFTQEIPMPDYGDRDLIYQFSFEREKYTSLLVAPEYNTTISFLGGLSFLYSSTFNVTLENDYEGQLIHLSGWDYYSGNSSTFSLLGLIYIPSNWNEVLNNQTPLYGYQPSLNSTLISLPWRVNSQEVNLSVITLQYFSETNDSVFTLSFDLETRFLLHGTLLLDEDSWVQGYELAELRISRTFLVSNIKDIRPYQFVDWMLNLLAIVLFFGIIGGSIFVFHLRERKLAHFFGK
ncbi:MAG: hypothetical protein ACW98F_17175, partial [Candidatus Hodarchaeales archaeon]